MKCESCEKERPVKNAGDATYPIWWCRWCRAAHTRKFKRSR